MLHLRGGGFIATYRCTAACKHCLYASSPKREKDYVTRQMAGETLAILKEHGCDSLHIGGGEPFIDRDGLTGLLREFADAGVGVDYVETNGFWAKGDQRDDQLIEAIAQEGVDTLMLSLCPFHTEYVPMQRILWAADACHRNGMRVFIWQERFAKAILRMGDPTKTHTLEEYEQANPGGVERLPREFGLRLGGRAAVTYADARHVPVEELLRDTAPCTEPLHTGHFHVDCFGDFIPPGCPGIAFPLAQIDSLDEADIPAIRHITRGGAAEIARQAMRLDFTPREEYSGACAFCQHARAYLCARQPESWADLRPQGFYRELYSDLFE